MPQTPHPGRRLDVLSQDHFPAYVVWELTLKFDLACTHRGTRSEGMGRVHLPDSGGPVRGVGEGPALRSSPDT